MTPGYVYLFRSENGLYKIGRSADPQRRLLDFATGAVAVKMVHQIRSDEMGWLEARLQRAHAGKRVRGEWFALSPEDVAAFIARDVWNWEEEPAKTATPNRLPSARIDAEVYRLARTVAAWRGQNISEYLSEVAGPLARRDMAAIKCPEVNPPEDNEPEGCP